MWLLYGLASHPTDVYVSGCCFNVAILAIPAVLLIALACVPLLVKVLDRNAGWPLAITFLALAGYLISHAKEALHGSGIFWAHSWIKGFLAGSTSQHVADLSSVPDNVSYNSAFSGDMQIALRLDALSLAFTLLALIIGAVVFIYSTRYLHRGTKIMSFYVLMTTFMLSVVVLFLADDVILLFIGWELVSLASFFLIARAGSSGEAGSIRTLLLTFTGGLFLVAALAIMVATTGSMSIAEIIASPKWHDDPVRLALVAILLAMAAFSKAAQIPFHFWLPEAMAADTPVSAFLHAAAVVKAGIFLLLRFNALFAGVMVWHYLLIIVGMATAVMAAVYAMQKTDLKKLTAYSTVSQLGWIVATIGVGTPFAISAAIAHTAAHALFKSSLFMLAGVIDHQAGSRDIRRLGSLWRQMPITFGSAVIAAASMAAIPPTFGFVTKEGMLDAFTEAPFNSIGVGVLLTVAGVGALATLLYSARYVFGAFIDGERDMSTVKEAQLSLVVPAALPGVLSLPLVLFMGRADHSIDAVVQATGAGETHTHLALWHGVTLPLIISLIVMAVGLVAVIYRRHVFAPLEDRRLGLISGADIIQKVATFAQRFGKIVARPAGSIAPSQHVLWILAMIILLAAFSIMGPGRIEGLAALSPRVSGIDRPEDLIGLVIVAAATISLTATRSRFASVILVGMVGAGVSWVMLTLGAPDVAQTQLLVEFCVVVLMMLVIRYQPRLYLREGENRTKFATTLAVVMGLITFFAVWFLIGRHDKPQIAQWYLENTPDISGANNVVAAILVEFRAFDTMGELIVLGMAGIVIAAIIGSIPRSPFPGYGPGSTAELFRAPGTHRFPDVHKVPELAPFYSKYLRSTYLNSIASRMALRPLLPVLVILSAIVFWRGHQAPGGGFLAALIAACALLYVYLAKPSAKKLGSDEAGYRLVGSGILLALVTGLVGFTKGSFLAPLHTEIAGIHLTTSLLFDGGVYLAVIGLIVIVVNQMGGRERPGVNLADMPFGRRQATFSPKLNSLKDSREGHPVEGKQAEWVARHSPVAVHAGGSHVPLNPTEIKEHALHEKASQSVDYSEEEWAQRGVKTPEELDDDGEKTAQKASSETKEAKEKTGNKTQNNEEGGREK